MEPIILKDVSKFDAQGTAVLDRVNIEIESGTTLCLIGPEKSGKSCLLSAISGNMKVDKGEIYFGEGLVNSPSKLERIGHILSPLPEKKKFALPFPRNTVSLKLISRERLNLISNKIGIDENELIGKRKRYHSKGEKQKFRLAKYLLTQRNIFLLDDPFTGMDTITRRKTRETLKELLRELKVTTMLITYFTEEAFYLGDRVAIMRAGKVEQIGGKEIIEQPANDFVREYIKEPLPPG